MVVLVLLVLCAAAWPMARAIFVAVRAAGPGTDLAPDAGRLWTSVWTAAAIATIATALAIAPAWALRRRPGLWLPLIAAPMFLPPYAAYSGWGLLRSPGTVGAEMLAGAPEQVALLVSSVLAVGGLALWAWPIAVLLLGAWVWRIDPEVLDAVRIEPLGVLGRARVRVALLRPALLRSWLVVFLVMLGSAVPLHVAQVETYAIGIWIDLALEPAPDVWLGAWPLLAAGACAAGLLAWRVDVRGPVGRAAGPISVGSISLVSAAVVWVASVLVPAALFLFIGLRNPSTGGYRLDAFSRFWGELGGAMGHSLVIACLAGLSGGALAIGVWVALDTAPRVARAAIGLLALTALVPGILIGGAVQEAYAGPLRPIGDSILAVVLAHIARFGAIGAIGGWWLARSEPGELRDLRRLDPDSCRLRRWWMLTHPHSTVGVGAISLVMGILSFHEIEAAIMVLPPGVDNYPQRMLQLLHFQREDTLSVGVLYGMGLGLAGTLIAAAGLRLVLARHHLARPAGRI